MSASTIDTKLLDEPQDSNEETGSKQIERKRAEGYKIIYANNVQVRTSVYDVAIDLGQVQDDISDENKIISFDQARVYLSPAHAKALAMLLLKSVVAYEAQHAKLPDTVEIPFRVTLSPKDE